MRCMHTLQRERERTEKTVIDRTTRNKVGGGTCGGNRHFGCLRTVVTTMRYKAAIGRNKCRIGR